MLKRNKFLFITNSEQMIEFRKFNRRSKRFVLKEIPQRKPLK